MFQDGTGAYRSTYMQHFLPMLKVLARRAGQAGHVKPQHSRRLPPNSQAQQTSTASPGRRCAGSASRYQASKEHCILATDLLYSRSAAQAPAAESRRRIASIHSQHVRQFAHDHRSASPTRGNTRFPTSGFTLFELSLQSPFQLSLTLLVRYRSRSNI